MLAFTLCNMYNDIYSIMTSFNFFPQCFLNFIYLDEMYEFLKTYKLPRLNHEEIENPKRPIMRKEIESVI